MPSATVNNADQSTIARYDYLLKTADPHQIKQVHREAFERLTPMQRCSIGNDAGVLAIREGTDRRTRWIELIDTEGIHLQPHRIV